MDVRRALRRLADPAKARVLQGFFKTGPGEYGEGDRFLGIAVPQVRALCADYPSLTFVDLLSLLRSPVHEERFFALAWLVLRFKKAGQPERKRLYDFYLAHTSRINNWDLVDLSAGYIVGPYLRLYCTRSQSLKVLLALARSPDIWERRIAIISTFDFIRANDFSLTLKIASVLLGDRHDLMHKAVGWMLREVGKRDQTVAEGFLRPVYRRMPRTMLRYAIERFPQKRRKAYLEGRV